MKGAGRLALAAIPTYYLAFRPKKKMRRRKDALRLTMQGVGGLQT
jgi:hypothetical protein